MIDLFLAVWVVCGSSYTVHKEAVFTEIESYGGKRNCYEVSMVVKSSSTEVITNTYLSAEFHRLQFRYCDFYGHEFKKTEGCEIYEIWTKLNGKKENCNIRECVKCSRRQVKSESWWWER